MTFVWALNPVNDPTDGLKMFDCALPRNDTRRSKEDNGVPNLLLSESTLRLEKLRKHADNPGVRTVEEFEVVIRFLSLWETLFHACMPYTRIGGVSATP